MRWVKTAVMLALLLKIGAAQAQLYAVVSAEGISPDADSLLRLDEEDGTILERIPLTLSTGGAPDGIVGIAAHPHTRVIYLILDTSPRSLATVSPATGVVTPIGSLGEYFSSLTFGADGTLYAIAGANNNDDPGSVHTVNLTTAATTLFRASADVLPGGFPDQGGMSIDMNTADGRMYFSATFGFDQLLRMELNSKLATAVPLSAVLNAQAMTFEPASGTFLLWSEESSPDEFLRVNPTTGEVEILNTDIAEDNTIRGLELITAQPQAAPAMNLIGLAAVALGLALLGIRSMKRAG